MYVIKSMAMMHYLVREGFDIIKFEDSDRNPELKVFLFKDSPELRKAMTVYTNNRK